MSIDSLNFCKEVFDKWAKEQGFKDWMIDHHAVMVNLARWLTRESSTHKLVAVEHYRHLKTGNIYQRLHDALDTERNTAMVVYRRMKTGEIYVRPADLFAEKFEKLEIDL